MAYEPLPLPFPTEIVEPVEANGRDEKGVAIYSKSKTSEILDLEFNQEVKTGITTSVATDPDSRFITLTPGHGMITGNYPVGDVGTIFNMANITNGRFIQAVVLGVAGDVIEINQLIGDVFPADSPVETGNRNLALANGSTTPVIFKIRPLSMQKGDIVRIILSIVGPSEMSFQRFGSDNPLPIGLLFRYKRGDGSYKNLRTVAKAQDMGLWGFDRDSFTPKAGNLDHGQAFRVTFGGKSKHDSVISLEGSKLNTLECVVLDDLLSGINSEIRVMGEGSEIQG